MVPIHTMLKTGGSVVVSDYIYPSVFAVSPSGRDLIIERKVPDSGGSGTKWLTSVSNISDPYIVFYMAKISDEANIDNSNILESRHLIYDRRTQTLSEGGFLNRDIASKGTMDFEGWRHELPPNMMVEVLPTDILDILNDKGRLSGPLKELVDTLDTEANDILMIVNLNKDNK